MTEALLNTICDIESMIQFDKDFISDDFIKLGENIHLDDVNNKIEIDLKTARFGIVNLKINKKNPIIQKRHFVFVTDCSGSMSDVCNDGRMKIDHSNHTLINMITYFAEHHELGVSITVFAFDDSFYTIIENEQVTQDNLDKLIQDVKKIRPKGVTNIEKALNNSSDYIIDFVNKNMDTYVTHIFMTDGDATQGNTIPSELKKCLTPLVSNIFIGFGIEHNSYLLKELSGHDNKNNYYFVDELEKAGFVYGEVLHSVIYRNLENTVINVTNGLIYDWKKNIWVSSINIGDLISESKKIFHILSENPQEFSCEIHSVDCSSKELFDKNIKKTDDYVDLSDYKYRQKTLQLLFEVNTHNFNKIKCYDPIEFNRLSKNNDYDAFCKKIQDDNKILQEKMKDLLREMKEFASTLSKDSCGLIKMLCDDIYICMQTFNQKYSAMYSCARQVSQGSQRSYSATYAPKYNNNNFDSSPPIPILTRSPPILMRSYAGKFDFHDDDEFLDPGTYPQIPDFGATVYDNNVFSPSNLTLKKPQSVSNNNLNNYDDTNEEYQVSEQIDNPYSTLSVLSLMRSCSANIDDDK
jgi:hypothetical protein